MPTRTRSLHNARSASPRSRRTKARHWTRDEQIENAMEDDAGLVERGEVAVAVDELRPPLTAAERAQHGL